MDILAYTEKAVKKYKSDFKKGSLQKPCCCEICGNKIELIWHAQYIRKLITFIGIYHLPIRRLYCPVCKHTFSLIPNFIEKFCRYGKDIIHFAVKKLKKYTYDNVAEELLNKISIEIAMNTLSNWNSKFANQIV